MAAPFDRRLVPTPFAHAGYMAKLWEQLAWGMTIVISPTPWTAADMVALLGAERITVAGGVPTQWAKLLEEPGLDTIETGGLRIGVVATAPAPPELVERVTERLGCSLVVRYAMTESPSITGTEPGDPPDVSYRTVGRPQPGVTVELRDEAGAPVGAGEVGRVHVRSAGMMRGYWNAPELTADALGADGWLRSGDLGHLDPNGNLVLVGRVGDLYIRGGYNVYPLEVEHVLAEHPAVTEAAVLGVPAPVIGEIGVAFVVPVAGCDAPSLDELRGMVRSPARRLQGARSDGRARRASPYADGEGRQGRAPLPSVTAVLRRPALHECGHAFGRVDAVGLQLLRHRFGEERRGTVAVQ